jgi:hypothetical protein
MGTLKTVDRNAMTFVPIGGTWALWGVKIAVELAGPKRIGSTRDAHRLNEPNVGSGHKVQKQLQKSGVGCISAVQEDIRSEEAAKESKQMAELQERPRMRSFTTPWIRV